MVRVRDRFHPDPEYTALYHKINHGVYRHITGVTDGILEKSYALMTAAPEQK